VTGLSDLLAPDVLADPYPLYRRLREQSPVYFDPYLHAWVVTRYDDVVEVFNEFSATRTPPPDRLRMLGMAELAPAAEVMVRQMLFVDPPDHTRLRTVIAGAFSTRRVSAMRDLITRIAEDLLDRAAPNGRMDVLTEYGAVLPALVTAHVLGLPSDDHLMLKAWSETFAEILGNFQHNPDRAHRLLAELSDMQDYFRAAVRSARNRQGNGLVDALVRGNPTHGGLTEDEMVANLILTMVGGQETTTNLIGNGTLTLIRHPEQARRLRTDPTLFESAVEELLRYESPSQHTARIVPRDTELGGQQLRAGQAVIAVIGAANRDPDHFPDPDTLDLGRPNNRHLAFGWSAHFCFGAGLARIEGDVALRSLLQRFPRLRPEPGPVSWRANLGLRGLEHLWVRLDDREG
jgi:cytochrome P450